MAMRGLTMFISDIRQCSSKEQEQKRIEKELGKIRSKFSQTHIGGYQLKKYVWKIIYMMMLGVEVDFGHMEAVNLISSTKYSEKNVGYMACTLMLNEQNDILRLIIQSVKNDLASRNENMQCLALTCIANVGGEEFAESLAADVQKLLVSGTSRNFVRKKAALCLLRLFRKSPDIIQTGSWAPRIIDLLDNGNMGILTSVMSLLIGLASVEPGPYEPAVSKLIAMLAKLHARECERSYIYYYVACPWLQIKILKFLQYFPPPKSPTLYSRLLGQLAKMVDDLSKDASSKSKNINRLNAAHSVLFEVINLIIHLNLTGSHDLLGRVICLLGTFVSVSSSNLRYLSMEAMSRLAKIPGTTHSIKSHQSTIISLLKDSDIFLRKRALDMLFCMCDESNSRQIVQELLLNLAQADYAIREEMVLKIAILTENFTEDFEWYIDVVLELIAVAGDFVTEDIWHRIIQVVTNNEDLQVYAAQRVYDALCSDQVHETLLKVGGYILGEFGHLITEDTASPRKQFEVLASKFGLASLKSKALLLSTFMKMTNLYPELKNHIMKVFGQHRSFVDDEIQQRSVEYYNMVDYEDQELVSQIWEMMPPFPERESSLLQLMRARGGSTNVRAPKHARPQQESDEGSESDSDQSSSDSESEVEENQSEGSDEEEESDIDENGKGDGMQQTQQADVADLLNVRALTMNSSSFENAHASASQPGAVSQDLSFVSKLLFVNKGVLLESEELQIGVMMQVNGSHQLKMILYIGNKNQSFGMQNVSLEIPTTRGLKADIRPVGPISIDPGKQLPLYVLWSAAQPFPPCPKALLRYHSSREPISIPLLLPVSIFKFCSPVNIDGSSFLEQWKHCSVESKFVLQYKSIMKIEALKTQFTTGLSLRVVEGLDRNPNSVVAAGRFHFIGADGSAATAPILVRAEVHPPSQQMRVTSRANHRIVNAAIEATFKAAAF